MAAQVLRGDEVTYFFSGRQYPWVDGPRLRRWHRAGVTMLEVVNSPLYDHGFQPELEVAEPRIERMLARTLEEGRPDVVHVQELAGLPSSVLEVARSSGVPAVMTLQDYFPLCSTFKLLDAGGRVCLRREIGADCVATHAANPRDPGLLVDGTVRFELLRMPIVRSLPPARKDPWVFRLAEIAARTEVRRREGRAPTVARDADAFQRRRELNVDRLNRADCLIAMSHRVAEIYSTLGVEPSRLRTVHLTLAHIERLRPRRPTLGAPPTFATLGGFESPAKGAELLLEALELLSEPAAAGRVRLLVFGYVEERFEDAVARLPGVELRGRFRPSELDAILDEVDVGIMPSVWEEAYGYAGMEFLAKGIPVIANAIGGMPDYVREGETGWLNRSCSAAELASIVARLVERPEPIAELNARLRADRATLVKSMDRHAAEMSGLYGDLIDARAG